MPLVLTRPRAHDDVVAVKPDPAIAIGDALALLLDGLQAALSQAADHGFPVDAQQEAGHVRAPDTGCIAGADQSAHAGAGDAVDGYMHFLKHLEHAHVRRTLGSAACEHQADARPDSGGRRGAGVRRQCQGCLERHCRHQDGNQAAPAGTSCTCETPSTSAREGLARLEYDPEGSEKEFTCRRDLDFSAQQVRLPARVTFWKQRACRAG